MPTTTSGGLIKASSQWTPEQYAWLKAQAAARGLTSVAAVLRVMVQAAMPSQQRDGSPEEPAA